MPLPSIEETTRRIKQLRALIYETRGLVSDLAPLIKDIIVIVAMTYLALDRFSFGG